ncbi:MAG TPA: YsnF/AvaK domain-containing protein [Acetobacteraceae bacterium]|nr:YsnF/AvaK domain-containing protein [Acetobacteraceae bacterium]
MLDERLRVGVRSVGSDRVVLHKTVRREDATAEAVLRTESLDVERIPIGRVVEAAPPVREEGDTLIVPVLEEIMVVETRLVLKEELRVRRITGSRTEHRVVRLRREEVAVEHPEFSRSDTTAEERPMSTTQSANPLSPDAGGARQIVAMFETYEEARSARDKLEASGIARSEMDLLDSNAQEGDFDRRYESTGTGLWASIRSMFVPEDDAHGYAEGVERGHAMLVVRPSPEQRDEAVRILESYEPIDFDARQAQWRESGWSGVHQGAAPAAAAVNPSPQQRDAGRTGSEADALVAGSDSLQGRTGSGDLTGATANTPPLGRAGESTHRDPALGTGRDDVIPVVEERLRVGKREVAQGAVRVRSYVVETPVEEQVRLRQEGVQVERRPVDRPAADLPADAFRERTIEVQATSEEPVLSKEARVVEEVELRKEIGERTETVRDTTRRTEVKVEDDRAGAPGASGAVTSPPRT